MNLCFETLPKAIEEIQSRLERIEALLCSPDEKKPENDMMMMDEAIEFLKQNGRPTSKSTIYKESSLGWIPSKRIGKRLVFSRIDLKTWIDHGMPKRIAQDAIDLLSLRMNRYDKERRA